MSTNIVIALDTRRKKEDGTYPLVMRLGHNRRTTTIPLGISLPERFWDEKSRTIRNSYEGVGSVTRMNNLIQKTKAEAMDAIMKLHESGELDSLSVTAVRDRVYKPATASSFFAFSDQLIAILQKEKRVGTAISYRQVNNVLLTFCGGKDLQFSQITYAFLTKLETHHIAKGNTYNSLAVYMRTIKAIYNKAIKAGVIERERYPFTGYKIKTMPTEKRALDWDFLKKIIELQIEPSHECFHARNYFLASYMMYGMNFTDMAFLKREDIVSGRITYRRKKTGKIYDIKITASLEAILTYYMEKSPESPYVFPIIKRDAILHQYKDIGISRKHYNKKLKVLAGLCKIEQNLTAYVSRHSFATQAMLQQVPVTAISTMLGHSSIKTTEIYLKSLPSNILDDYNARIMGM